MPNITFRNLTTEVLQLVIEPWAALENIAPGATALLEYIDPARIEFCSNSEDLFISLMSDWIRIPFDGQQREFPDNGSYNLTLPGSENAPKCFYTNGTEKDVTLLIEPSGDLFTVAPSDLNNRPWNSMVWFDYNEPADIEFAIMENGQPRLTFNGNNVVAYAVHVHDICKVARPDPSVANDS